MRIKDLKKSLKSKLGNRNFSISQPWELLKFKYLEHLEVRSSDILFTLKLNDKAWEVTIEERGTIQELKSFLSESDACEYFEKLLIN